MKKHWKKFVILAMVVAVVVMFSIPGAILADTGRVTFTKEVSPSTVVVGDTVTYTFTVTASKDYELREVVITDDKIGYTETIGDIPKKGELTYTFDFVTTEPGELKNTATVTGEYELREDNWRSFGLNSSNTVTVLPKGEKGDTGTTGATGSTGSSGPQGATGSTGSSGPQGDTGSTGSSGSRGPRGRSGKDVVRMFSTDGGDKDPWSLTSESVDKYMLESTTYAGKTTHIIVEIEFMVEQADGSLVFMSK